MFAIIEVKDEKELKNLKNVKIVNSAYSLEYLMDYFLIQEAKKENLENIKYEEVLKKYGINLK